MRAVSVGGCWTIAGVLSGCASMGSSANTPPVIPSPPAYTQVAHPTGMDLFDLKGLVESPEAKAVTSAPVTCDQPFRRLREQTLAKAELETGLRELVGADPVLYHWCFYTTLYALSEALQQDLYLEEKQKRVITAFEFLVPVARVFQERYQESRYLRWAVQLYQRWSPQIFYRKVDLTPQGTLELSQPMNPQGLWRQPHASPSLIQKYHLDEEASSAPPAPPAPTPSGGLLE